MKFLKLHEILAGLLMPVITLILGFKALQQYLLDFPLFGGLTLSYIAYLIGLGLSVYTIFLIWKNYLWMLLITAAVTAMLAFIWIPAFRELFWYGSFMLWFFLVWSTLSHVLGWVYFLYLWRKYQSKDYWVLRPGPDNIPRSVYLQHAQGMYLTSDTSLAQGVQKGRLSDAWVLAHKDFAMDIAFMYGLYVML